LYVQFYLNRNTSKANTTWQVDHVVTQGGSEGFMVKTATVQNGDTKSTTKKPSQNGDKPYNECDCVCVDLSAVSVTVVVHCTFAIDSSMRG